MRCRLCLALVSWLLAAPVWCACADDAPPLAMRELAGEYSCGDEHLPPGERLKLAPSGEFEHELFYCFPTAPGEKPAKTYATLQNGVLTLRRSSSTRRGKDTYYPVRWGRRMYIVPTAMIDDFCDEVNSGDEPRHKERGSVFLLRRGDWNWPVSGLPEVPDAYRRYLLARPLVGNVTTASKNKFQGQINLGSNDGVWKGMRLYATFGQGAHSGRLGAKVFWVDEHSCWISDDDISLHLQVGQTVYSRDQP